jgi:hypothetical protein
MIMKRTLRTILVIGIMTLMAVSAGAMAKDDRFVVYKDSETVLDTKTGLMWAAKDNGSDISWAGAKSHCENYRAGGYSDWRMPTQDELASLYDADKTRPASCAGNFTIHVATKLIDATCLGTWSKEAKGADAAQFSFVYGTPSWYLQTHTYGMRALPVRTHK